MHEEDHGLRASRARRGCRALAGERQRMPLEGATMAKKSRRCRCATLPKCRKVEGVPLAVATCCLRRTGMPHEATAMAKRVASMPIGDAGGASGRRTLAAASGCVAVQSGTVATPNAMDAAESGSAGEKSRIDAARRRRRSAGSRTHAASSDTVAVRSNSVATSNPKHAVRSQQRWRKKSHRCGSVTPGPRARQMAPPTNCAAAMK